jgi:hypothetical protein
MVTLPPSSRVSQIEARQSGCDGRAKTTQIVALQPDLPNAVLRHINGEGTFYGQSYKLRGHELWCAGGARRPQGCGVYSVRQTIDQIKGYESLAGTVWAAASAGTGPAALAHVPRLRRLARRRTAAAFHQLQGGPRGDRFADRHRRARPLQHGVPDLEPFLPADGGGVQPGDLCRAVACEPRQGPAAAGLPPGPEHRSGHRPADRHRFGPARPRDRAGPGRIAVAAGHPGPAGARPGTGHRHGGGRHGGDAEGRGRYPRHVPARGAESSPCACPCSSWGSTRSV